MPNLRSNYAVGKLPTRVCAGAEVIPLFYEIDVPATGDGTVLNDTIEMGPLPANHVPVDVVFASDDLDSGTGTIALAFGVLNSTKTDLSTAAADGGAAWASALNIAAAGGIGRPTTKAIYDVQPAAADRPLAYKVTTAANVRQAGKLRVTVYARAVP